MDYRDLLSPATFADEPYLHELTAHMRAHDPLPFIETDTYKPLWVCTKHADILEVERQHAKFPNTANSVLRSKEIELREGAQGPLLRTLINMDEPDHKVFRDLTKDWFMPNNIRKVEGRVQAIAKAAVDRMLELGPEIDFVRDVAIWYPLRVIMMILGVPEEDEPRMLQHARLVFFRHPEDHHDHAQRIPDGHVANEIDLGSQLEHPIHSRFGDGLDATFDLPDVVRHEPVFGQIPKHLVIGLVHVDQRAQQWSLRALPQLDLLASQDRVRSVRELRMLALDLEDVGVFGADPERLVRIRFDEGERIVGAHVRRQLMEIGLVGERRRTQKVAIVQGGLLTLSPACEGPASPVGMPPPVAAKFIVRQPGVDVDERSATRTGSNARGPDPAGAGDRPLVRASAT